MGLSFVRKGKSESDSLLSGSVHLLFSVQVLFPLTDDTVEKGTGGRES